MDTVDLVPTSMCKDVEMGAGISLLVSDSRMPDTIDMINGFFESLLATCFIASHFVDFSSLYISRIERDVMTLTIEMEAADKVARRSPSVGKANVTNGMPKKARLPKIVLKIRR